MTVAQLMEALAQCDPDADILVSSPRQGEILWDAALVETVWDDHGYSVVNISDGHTAAIHDETARRVVGEVEVTPCAGDFPLYARILYMNRATVLEADLVCREAEGIEEPSPWAFDIEKEIGV